MLLFKNRREGREAGREKEGERETKGKKKTPQNPNCFAIPKMVSVHNEDSDILS